MTETERLIDKLRRIEALFAGATTAGERAAAGNALERMLARLAEAEQRDPATEYRFSFDSPWSHKLFCALLRRYGIRPYRYFRQRYTIVMARVSHAFVEETLWPEYEALNAALREHLEAVTNSIIAQAVSADLSEPQEIGELGPGTSGVVP